MGVKFKSGGVVTAAQVKAGLPAAKSMDYTDHLQPPPPKYVGKQAVAKIKVEKSGQVPEETEQVLATPLVPLQKLANLNITMSRTYNLGNYESVKINVSLTFPSHVDEINETYAFVEKWVGDKMATYETEIKGT